MSDLGPVPWWAAVALLTLVAMPLGWWLARELATGGYRLDEEWPEGALPAAEPSAVPFVEAFPGWARWAAVLALPALWGLCTWRLGGFPATSPGAGLPPYLLLAWLGVALVWTDLDVHRLPEGLTLPAYPAMALLLAVAAASASDWWMLGRAVLAGAAAYGAYLVLALVAGGGFGLGDVTLAGLVALPLGFLGWGQVLLGFVVAHLVGGLVALGAVVTRRAGRGTAIPFGPFLIVGALTAVLTSGQLVA